MSLWFIEIAATGSPQPPSPEASFAPPSFDPPAPGFPPFPPFPSAPLAPPIRASRGFPVLEAPPLPARPPPVVEPPLPPLPPDSGGGRRSRRPTSAGTSRARRGRGRRAVPSAPAGADSGFSSSSAHAPRRPRPPRTPRERNCLREISCRFIESLLSDREVRYRVLDAAKLSTGARTSSMCVQRARALTTGRRLRAVHEGRRLEHGLQQHVERVRGAAVGEGHAAVVDVLEEGRFGARDGSAQSCATLESRNALSCASLADVALPSSACILTARPLASLRSVPPSGSSARGFR